MTSEAFKTDTWALAQTKSNKICGDETPNIYSFIKPWFLYTVSTRPSAWFQQMSEFYATCGNNQLRLSIPQ